MTENKWHIRLSGSGGQGLVKASILLAEAAVEDGFNVTQSQVYGPEPRGGLVKAEINIAKNRILYTRVAQPNLLLCLCAKAYKEYAKELAPGGILIMDSEIGYLMDDELKQKKFLFYQAPIIQLAWKKLNSDLPTNVLALGIINGITGMLSNASFMEALNQSFHKDILQINIEAYHLGLETGRKLEDKLA